MTRTTRIAAGTIVAALGLLSIPFAGRVRGQSASTPTPQMGQMGPMGQMDKCPMKEKTSKMGQMDHMDQMSHMDAEGATPGLEKVFAALIADVR